MRCSECKEPAIQYTKYMNWLEIVYFIDHLHLNGDISNELHDLLYDILMSFKSFAEAGDEDEVLEIRKQVKALKRELRWKNRLLKTTPDKE